MHVHVPALFRYCVPYLLKCFAYCMFAIYCAMHFLLYIQASFRSIDTPKHSAKEVPHSISYVETESSLTTEVYIISIFIYI